MTTFPAFHARVGVLALAAVLLPAIGVLGAEAALPVPSDQPTTPQELPTPTSPTAPATPTVAVPPPLPPATSDATATTATPAARDPTVPSVSLRSALDKSQRAASASARPVPPVKLPEIVRRAFIQVAGKPAQAIIEAGGTTRHTIVAGSQFTVDAGLGASLALRVVRLTADEIEIEIPSLHQTLVIR
jgi:hypothetical protein